MNATDSGIPIVVSDSAQKQRVYFSLADKVSKNNKTIIFETFIFNC